jgi:hypothetical protein
MRTAAQNHTYKSADNRPKSGTLVNTLISRVTYFLALAAIVISLIIGLLYYGIVFRQTVDLMEGMFTVLSPPLRSALERSDRSDEDLLLGGAIRYPVISEIYLLEGSAGQGASATTLSTPMNSRSGIPTVGAHLIPMRSWTKREAFFSIDKYFPHRLPADAGRSWQI